MRARFALIQPYLSDVVTGRAEPDVARLAAELSGPAAVVLEAWWRAHGGDWAGVAALDSALATAGPRDPWFPAAAQLRAGWRTSLATVADRRAAAVEALAILDASMVLGAEPRDFLIRVDAAVRADLPHVLLETARTAATILAQRVAAADPAAAADLARTAAKLQRALEPLGRDPRVAPHRVEQVASRLARLVGAR
jgi:hypothetical protein